MPRPPRKTAWLPLARILAFGLALVAAPAFARPFGVDDLLKVEDVRGAWLAPGGRWLVIERTAPYDSGRAYDDDVFEPLALSRLDVVDLLASAPARAPLASEGLNAGPFSPDGRSMAVFRLRGHQWDLGVTDLERRTVRWFGLAVEPGLWGRSVQWRSDGELIAIAQPNGAASARFDSVWAAMTRPTTLWAAAKSGVAATDTVVGSGRFRGLTPQSPPARLVRVDVASGRAETLASGAFLDLELSGDRRYLAALGEADSLQPKASDVVRVGTSPRRRALTLVNLRDGAVTQPCAGRDFATHLLSWAPHQDQLLAYVRKAGDDWAAGALVRIDAQAGACSAVDVPGLHPAIQYGSEGFPIVRAEWLGSEPLVLAEPNGLQATPRRDWRRLSPQGPVDLTAAMADPPTSLAAIDDQGFVGVGPGGAARIDRLGRVLTSAPGFSRTVGEPGPGEGDRLSVQPPRGPGAWVTDGARLARIDERGFKQEPLSSDALPLARDVRTLVAKTTDAHGVSSLMVSADGRETILLQINPAYADIDFAEVQAVPYQGADGRALVAWLYRPAHLAAGRRPPLVVLPYPGSVYGAPPRAYAPGYSLLQSNPQVLAGAGYAVLVPSLPRDPASNAPATGLADQILKAVDAAQKTGLVDTSRMALWGHSFGGYGVLAAATQTGRFLSVIATAGPTDLISLGGIFTPQARSAPEDGLSINPSIGWLEAGQGHLGGPPSADIQRFARNSPALNVDRIQCPVLLIHGDQDFVPLSQSEELFSALYRQDKDAVLVTLWGEGHTATSPANIRRMYEWILWWLGQTVGPGVES
jgi:dipeptidyl aminopeptidase/acylaminoacyl peptidase